MAFMKKHFLWLLVFAFLLKTDAGAQTKNYTAVSYAPAILGLSEDESLSAALLCASLEVFSQHLVVSGEMDVSYAFSGIHVKTKYTFKDGMSFESDQVFHIFLQARDEVLLSFPSLHTVSQGKKNVQFACSDGKLQNSPSVGVSLEDVVNAFLEQAGITIEKQQTQGEGIIRVEAVVSRLEFQEQTESEPPQLWSGERILRYMAFLRIPYGVSQNEVSGLMGEPFKIRRGGEEWLYEKVGPCKLTHVFFLPMVKTVHHVSCDYELRDEDVARHTPAVADSVSEGMTFLEIAAILGYPDTCETYVDAVSCFYEIGYPQHVEFIKLLFKDEKLERIERD